MAFDPTQAFPSVVIAWIRFPALLSYLFNHKIITEIRELVGKVVKLDMNIDSRTRGRFARMAVYINLEKPLVSQVLINGRIQKIEYESLSTICFHCERYGHVESICKFRNANSTVEMNGDSSVPAPENQKLTVERLEKKEENFGPWMIVERKSRHKSWDNLQKLTGNHEKKKSCKGKYICNTPSPSPIAGLGYEHEACWSLSPDTIPAYSLRVFKLGYHSSTKPAGL
ncbi:hypothetical protein CXB51_036497 [Gossypium anomalum]|uniref:DUF4283 domain-containing protein n=1 Tax=Gossypium anomalum TaxID=47600 RepID=A0A8J6CGM7_9ROSI|nr:hypothetical protein CXB51_036497 [Gossypium anomalum]